MIANVNPSVMQRAYNTVILPSGRRLSPAVCTFDGQGRVTSVELLTKELPFVEWIGGTLDLSAQTALETT